MKMIPSEISDKTRSAAERKVFRMLKESCLEGVALHSLDLASHNTKIYGEIDFVVITSRGVLCLEVKGGEVCLNHGQWEYISRVGHSNMKKESPFHQARGNKESLMNYVRSSYKKKNGGEIKYCVYGYGVVIPDTAFREQGAEIDTDIVFDNTDINFDDYITDLYDTWEARLSTRLNLKEQQRSMPRLRQGHINLLVDLLVGTSHTTPVTTISRKFSDIDGKLKELSDQQYRIFEYGMKNRRQLIEGGAGTGKTIIVMKYALEKAREGNRVLFLCFNKLLAKWIQTQLTSQADATSIEVDHFHNYLMKETQLKVPQCKSEWGAFYTKDLPEAFLQTAHTIEPYDILVVDEGQDLLSEEYLLCLDLLITGGLSHGSWIMMYDQNQNIYLRESFHCGLESLMEFNPFVGQLSRNYRNTRQINEVNEKLTEIRTLDYCGMDGEEAEITEYSDNADAQSKLKSIVKALRKRHVAPKDIVILSPHRFEGSILEGKRNLFEGIAPIQPMQNKDGDLVATVEHAIKFSTIYSYKGLESHIVIVTELDKMNDFTRKLFYTGISRAKSKVYILKKKNI